jgi:hypothetical protein
MAALARRWQAHGWHDFIRQNSVSFNVMVTAPRRPGVARMEFLRKMKG